MVAVDRTPAALAEALGDALAQLDSIRGARCEQAVLPYYPERVLHQIYDNHRTQGRRQHSGALRS
jgi:hypothetical protein